MSGLEFITNNKENKGDLKMGLVIFSVILVIGLFGILGANFRKETWRIRPRQLLSIFGLLLLLFGAFKTVDATEVVVVTRFGEVQEVVTTSGLKVKSPLDDYHVFDKTVRSLTIVREVYTKDLQAVEITFVVEYRIDPSKVEDLYLNYKTLDNVEAVLQNPVWQATELVAKDYTARELTTLKVDYVANVQSTLVNSLSPYFINVYQIRLTNTVYTPEFESLLQDTLLAEQEKAKQEAELEIQLQAAEYAVQVAEQKALEDLAKAQGQANANLAIAQAEANAIELVSQANAEAYAAKIREIAAQLGIDPLTATQDQIDSLLSYIKYLEYLATWDGRLPEFVTDGSGIIVQP